jgi:predicted  nucleic acid-binding Zn-ribbon protein
MGTIATVTIALVTFYGAVSTRLARLETKMDAVAEDMRKTSSVAERTATLERDMQTCFLRIDEMRDEVHDLRKRLEQ